MLCLVAQLYLTLCDPMDCNLPGASVHGILQARILERVAMPPPGDLPNLGIKPRSPALQTDSLSSEPPGKPKNTGMGSLSLLQGIFLTQESNWGLLHCRWIFYQLSYQGSQGVQKSYLHNRGGENSRWRLKTNRVNCLRVRLQWARYDSPCFIF